MAVSNRYHHFASQKIIFSNRIIRVVSVHLSCKFIAFFLELTAATKNLEAMKKQAQSTNAEYDRLMKEHTQLQVRLVMNLNFSNTVDSV